MSHPTLADPDECYPDDVDVALEAQCRLCGGEGVIYERFSDSDGYECICKIIEREERMWVDVNNQLADPDFQIQ